ncbi:MAG TPA: prepilin-type N-terminal cleavage/methylation domain-containing protein [Kofleriaceae bacterium]|nr:prepilin-type N-terminal cleavage/methylation domain-containing protein [Kofleriaceae bacterium]
MRGGGQRGFTLVELMVALVVSSLLIGMILSIFTRMSMAYRAQQNVAELQQTLAAAQELLQRDVRQAGYQIPDGFLWAGAETFTQPPLQVVNNADNFGPDLLRVFHADASAQARVDSAATDLVKANNFTTLVVDDRDLFQNGDLAVMVTVNDKESIPLPNKAKWLHYRACVVRIANIAGDVFSLDTAAPWGTAGNHQCDTIREWMATSGATGMVYRFSARAYRIDPQRRSLAVLQMSPTGGLVADDWQDLGVGFTDLQVATRWNDWAVDNDNTVALTWWSSEGQETQWVAVDPAADGNNGNDDLQLYHHVVPSELRISLVVRTIKKVDAVPTAATPNLTDAANTDHNDLGDRAPVQLDGVADAARPVELRGNAVFRHATIGADLRNLAVGYDPVVAP